MYTTASLEFIESVLLALTNERKVFWSETDFQFCICLEIKRNANA